MFTVSDPSYAPIAASGARNLIDMASISNEKPFLGFANGNDHATTTTTSMPPPPLAPASLACHHQQSFFRGTTNNASSNAANNASNGGTFRCYQQPHPPPLPPMPLKQPHYDHNYCATNNTRSSVSNADNYDTVDVPFMMMPAAVNSEQLLGTNGGIAQQQQQHQQKPHHLHPPPTTSTSSASASAVTNAPQQQHQQAPPPRPEQFTEITQMAMRGCELAERLAHTHRNRPCFKKIDSLCARMKQDLVRPDSVLANINSQGMAWAVKDFIFVFTRIINAWIIIKGYVYNTPDGLAKVKNALSPEFGESFVRWQQATMEFVDNLIKSFVNLDQMVQSQRNAFQKYDNMGNNCGGNNACSGGPKAMPSGGGGNMMGGGGGMQSGGNRKREAMNASGGSNGLGSADDHLMMIDETMADYMFKMFSLDASGGAGAAASTAAATAAQVGAAVASQQQHEQQQQQRNGICTGLEASAALLGSMLEHSPNGKSLVHGAETANCTVSPASINYLSNVIEDSEETQRQAMEKGTYFKTGLYNPLKKDLMLGCVLSSAADGAAKLGGANNPEPKSIFTQQSIAISASSSLNSSSIINANNSQNNCDMNNCGGGGGNQFASPPRILNRLQDLMCLDLGTSILGSGATASAAPMPKCELDRRCGPYVFGKPNAPAASATAASSEMLQSLLQPTQPNPNTNKIGDAAAIDAKLLEYLLTKICSLNEAKYFFAAQFTKNYVSSSCMLHAYAFGPFVIPSFLLSVAVPRLPIGRAQLRGPAHHRGEDANRRLRQRVRDRARSAPDRVQCAQLSAPAAAQLPHQHHCGLRQGAGVDSARNALRCVRFRAHYRHARRISAAAAAAAGERVVVADAGGLDDGSDVARVVDGIVAGRKSGRRHCSGVDGKFLSKLIKDSIVRKVHVRRGGLR